MRRNKSKRGQMEIMGLLIVVLLFSLGLLFALRYSILKPETKTKETFIQAQLSSNMLNAFLRTTSSCKDARMTDLFRDCAAFPSLDCDFDGLSNDGIMDDSCKELEMVLKQVFNETLDVWDVDYNFTAYVDPFNPIEFTKGIGHGECGDLTEGKPQQYPIPTDIGDLIVELKIC